MVIEDVVLWSLARHMWSLQVEAEANPEVSEKLEIATVPTFVLLKVCYYY